jgi:hypothetical protein
MIQEELSGKIIGAGMNVPLSCLPVYVAAASFSTALR